VVYLKFAEKLQRMAAAQVELKSPYVPSLYTLFSKGEFYPWDFNPSLEKRGRGDFRTE